MDLYRPVLFYLSQFIAIFALASFGTPKLSSAPHLILTLAVASGWVLYCGYLYYKGKRMLATMFLWSTALMPWVFYLELVMLQVSPFTLEGELDADKIKHVVVVYNLFRYVLLTLSGLTTLRDLLRALRN